MSTFDTPRSVSATVDIGLGDVLIRAGERATTVVDVRPSDPANDEDRKAAELTRVDCADGQLLVRAPKLRSWLSRSGGGSLQVTVDLPAGSDVQATVGSGDIQCVGPLGDCRVKTGLGHIRIEQAGTATMKSGAGDLTVDEVTGSADVTTGSGDVRLGSLGSGGIVKNSNGDTWIGVVGGDLRVNAANGSIAVDLARGSVAAKSANGDVRIGEVTRGTIVLETQIGDLEVGIPEGTAAWLDVSATAGRVHNSLAAAPAPEPPTDTVEVRARTTVGAIVIRRPR